MIRFDAYTATLIGPKSDELALMLFDTLGTAAHQSKTGHGFHAFGSRHSIKDESGSEVAAIQWGGGQGDRVMVEVKGEHTPTVVDELRSRWPDHRVTRVDSCADFNHAGAFEQILMPCEQVVRDRKIYAQRLGDWEQHPELGRTYMMGSKDSAVRCRLYEKGLQPEYRHLDMVSNWARLEVQVRPAKEAKEAYSTISPVDVWGASRWSRELASAVLQDHVDPHPAGTVYKLSERDSALSWMCKQYGPHLTSLASDLGGWDVLGLTLMEMISEQDRKRRRSH